MRRQCFVLYLVSLKNPLDKFFFSLLRFGASVATGNRIWTIHRQNQHHQNSSSLKRLISRVRQRIEGVFHEIQNTGRNPKRLLNKTVGGLATHLTAKIASHTLRLLLRERFAMDVLTLEFVTPS